SSGQIVTCTSSNSLAAGATATPITVNVSVAAVGAPSVTNQVSVAGGNETSRYANNNSAADYTLISLAAQTTLSTAGQQTTARGTAVFYSHIFMAGYDGNVTFTLADTPNPAAAGWSSSLFRDTNCNGTLEGTEGSTALAGSVAVTANAQVCLVARVL